MKSFIYNRQVFQTHFSRNNNVSLRCIDDLLISTRSMNVRDKKDVFFAQGLDYDNVNKYYNVVKYLNHTYYEVRPPIKTKSFVIDCFRNIVYLIQKIRWFILLLIYL